MSLIEDDAPRGNAPEYTVSEISGAVKRVIEGEFGRVRVRGELGRVSLPRSGHVYLDLKDDRSVLAGVIWKGTAARLAVRPEEGMEVIATGRLTTFPGQSKYQMVIETLEPAGIGALMALLEKRRAALAAEGLFDAARKRPLPYLPAVIGVVTSPSGAVIRDILHRLRDRFPVHVLVWPVAVQGERCAPEVAAAIAGFNALPEDGPVPRPDVLIVARGGGSVEDLWGFNEEIVVRAAAASRIPLISAVGHETDTTLIDHAADRRAPTPTAAAEMAVPVRADLLGWSETMGARLGRAVRSGVERRGQRLRDLARALPRPEVLVAQAVQRLDIWAERLPGALRRGVERRRLKLGQPAAALRPEALVQAIAGRRAALAQMSARLAPGLSRGVIRRRERLEGASSRLERAGQSVARQRMQREIARLVQRLDQAAEQGLRQHRERLAAAERLRQSLGYRQTLQRGYAVIRAGETVITGAAAAGAARELEIEFRDGRQRAVPLGAGDGTVQSPRRKRGGGGSTPPKQGSLF